VFVDAGEQFADEFVFLLFCKFFAHCGLPFTTVFRRRARRCAGMASICR
jgi:hypothetical protein